MGKNPWHPLPENYPDLSPEGQRQARLNVMTRWYYPGRPVPVVADVGAFVEGFHFYREWYCKGWEENKEWYYNSTPPMHLEWIQAVASHMRTALAAFRGSAKSTIIGKELIEFLLLTRPRFPVMVIKSTMDRCAEGIESIREQFDNNELILQDFGTLSASRTSSEARKWTTEKLVLPNRSSLVGRSVTGKGIRGGRPWWVIIDDAEDDEGVVSDDQLRKWEGFFFRKVLPTLNPGGHVSWIGTLLATKAWIVRAVRQEDSRFSNWWTKYYNIKRRDEQGHWVSNWPDKWPLTDIDYLESDTGSPDGRIQGVGRAVFLSEYMNQPTFSEDAALPFDYSRHAFQIVEGLSDPNAREVYDVATGEQVPLKPFLEGLRISAGVDLAISTDKSADDSAVVIVGVDADNCMWVLDSWAGKEHPSRVVIRAMALGQKWRAERIGFEANNFQRLLSEQAAEMYRTALSKGLRLPRPVPLTHGGHQSKAARILSLQFRFHADLIKIRRPYAQLGDKGLPELETQMAGWSPGAHVADDVLDALAMAQETLGNALGTRVVSEDKMDQALAEMREFGYNPLLALNPGNPEDVARMDQIRAEEKGKKPGMVFIP